VVALVSRTASALAQTPAESIAVWTERLRTGSLPDRADAIGNLAAQDLQLLPTGTRDVIVAELRRVNDATLNGVPIEGSDALTSEAFGEYYLDLSTTAARFGTPEANRALILASGISRGAQRRAARLGDEAVPVLQQMIDRDFDSADALETMALAWFWADSAGGPLSDTSRRAIIRALLRALRSPNANLRSGVPGALYLIGDPTFLPLAQAAVSLARATHDQELDAGYIRLRALPALESAFQRLTPLEIAQRAIRALSLICADGTRSERPGACQSLLNDLRTALEHLRAGRSGPAKNVLDAAAGRADTAFRNGVITEDEHAMIAGGVRQIIAVLR
jgi:hypothetical protein